jgi:hypothetical protein
MKTLRGVLAVLFVAGVLFISGEASAKPDSSLFAVGCKNGQCQAIAKSTGQQCKTLRSANPAISDRRKAHPYSRSPS